MALHDSEIIRTHGLRHDCPSLPTRWPRHQVREVYRSRDETGLVVDLPHRGRLPGLRNDDDRADDRRDRRLVPHRHGQDRAIPMYRDARSRQSVLTTSSTARPRFPSVRPQRAPLAPARTRRTASTAWLPPCCRSAAGLLQRRARRHLADERSPQGLGPLKEEQITSLVGILDAASFPDDSCAYDGTKGH